MKTSLKKQLVELTEKSPNQEICGLIYTNFDTVNYYSCENISKYPETNFEISSDDFIKVENIGDIVGVFHSHINETSEFSDQDIENSNAISIPYFCYSDFDKKFREYRPKEYKPKLIGRHFIRGQTDCFSLIRDYYWNNFEYLFDDFDRDEDFDNSNSSIIMDVYESQGFFIPENQVDIKEHDLIVSKSIKSAHPTHLEVFVGNSKTLQHLINRLSCKDYLREGLLKKTMKVLRFNRFGEKRYISFC